MGEYRIFHNEEYLIESVNRYRRQRHIYPWFIVLKAICALGLALLIGLCIYGALTSTLGSGPLVLIALIFSVFLFLLLLGPRMDYFFLKRKLRKSPFYGDEINIVVSPEGMSIRSPKSKALLKWSAFSRAKQITSGFLLFSGSSNFNWLPNSALVQGTSEDVANLLQQSIASYEANDV